MYLIFCFLTCSGPILVKHYFLFTQGEIFGYKQAQLFSGNIFDGPRPLFPQFHETWTKLMDWLEESEKSLDSEVEIANDPDRIKAQLAQHKVRPADSGLTCTGARVRVRVRVRVTLYQ